MQQAQTIRPKAWPHNCSRWLHLAEGQARRQKHDSGQGAFIDCVLQTRLDTTVAGMTSCVVSRDIFSDNGKVKLIEKGLSRDRGIPVHDSTRNGPNFRAVESGQDRTAWSSIWHRLVRTLWGVQACPAISTRTSGIGSAERSCSAWSTMHLPPWPRVQAAQTVAMSTASRCKAWQRDPVDGGGSAEEATINIPPTLYKNQGEKVGIYVARDLDFSQVYGWERASMSNPAIFSASEVEAATLDQLLAAAAEAVAG